MQEAVDAAKETKVGASTFYSASETPPENPTIGDLWFDINTKFLKIFNGEAWELATPSNETHTFTSFILDSPYSYVNLEGLNEDAFVFLNGVKLIREITKADILDPATGGDYYLDLHQYRVYFKELSAGDVVQVVLAASDIASNNKTNVEDFIATEGQTVFNLTKSYVPTTDTLHVYVNGVRQSSYIESSSFQVTFNHGLSAGDEVTFISNQYLSSQAQGTTTAADVTFTPVGGIPTTVDAHLNVVDTRLTTLETSTTSSTAISGLDTRVSTLETDPTTGTAVNGLDTRVTALEAGSGSGSGSNNVVLESFTATASQTVFNLANAYTLGNNTLNVYLNGVRQTAYSETNTTRVTFTNPLAAGDEVVFITNEIQATATLSVQSSNSGAIAAGLAVGTLYRTSNGDVKVVY